MWRQPANPLGTRAAELDPTWRVMSSYNGWRMPTADYGRFYQPFAPGNPAIGPQARAWTAIAPRLDKGGGQGKLDRTLGGAAEAVRNWR